MRTETINEIFTSCFIVGKDPINFNGKTEELNRAERIDFSPTEKILSYCLPEFMNSSLIQEETGNPGFMEEKKFIYIMSVLLSGQTDLIKEILDFSFKKNEEHFLIHHLLGGREAVSFFFWDEIEWHWYTEFISENEKFSWNPKIKFLYFPKK